MFKFLCELTNLQNNLEAVLTERPGEGLWKPKIHIGPAEDCYKTPRGPFRRTEASPGAADPSLLSPRSVGPLAKPVGQAVLAQPSPQALAARQPGTLIVHPLRTLAP